MKNATVIHLSEDSFLKGNYFPRQLYGHDTKKKPDLVIVRIGSYGDDKDKETIEDIYGDRFNILDTIVLKFSGNELSLDDHMWSDCSGGLAENSRVFKAFSHITNENRPNFIVHCKYGQVRSVKFAQSLARNFGYFHVNSIRDDYVSQMDKYLDKVAETIPYTRDEKKDLIAMNVSKTAFDEGSFNVDVFKKSTRPVYVIRIVSTDTTFSKDRDWYKELDIADVMTFRFPDTSSEIVYDQFWSSFNSIGDCIEMAKQIGANILVHCEAGLSRSGAVVEATVRYGYNEVPGVKRTPNAVILKKLLNRLGIEINEETSAFNEGPPSQW